MGREWILGPSSLRVGAVPACRRRSRIAPSGRHPTSERSAGMTDIAVESPLSEAVRSLGEQVRGQVITAADEDYDEARRVHNGMFDRRPTAVLKAEQVGD